MVLSGNEPTCQCRRHKRHGFDPWVRKIPRRRKWQPTPVFLPGEFHGQRGLASYSPWGRKESDTTEVTARRQAKSPGVLGENMKVQTLCHVKEPGSLGLGDVAAHQRSRTTVRLSALSCPICSYSSLQVSTPTPIEAVKNKFLTSSFTLLFSHPVMCNSATPGSVAHRAPLSTGFSRQEYWGGLPSFLIKSRDHI